MRIVIEIDGLPVANTTGAPRTDLAATARVSPLPSEPADVVETVDAGSAALPAELLATVGAGTGPVTAEGVAIAEAVDAGAAPDEDRGHPSSMR